MIVARSIAGVRAALRQADDAGAPARPLGFVPTMGALHDGHLTLVGAARAACGRVAASIFVNPAQFNDAADLAAYPRDEARDASLLERAGVDVLFLPEAPEVYPPGFATWVEAGGVADGYEGQYRPGHFRGVATVCLKLFHIIRPDVAYFGQKDAQQVAVIRQLVRDTNLDLRVDVVPTVRDADGLAMSSRNVRLSRDARQQALAIPRALSAALEARQRGTDPVEAARQALAGLDVEYAGVAMFDDAPTMVVAVRVGGIRLIDNVPLDRPAMAGL